MIEDVAIVYRLSFHLRLPRSTGSSGCNGGGHVGIRVMRMRPHHVHGVRRVAVLHLLHMLRGLRSRCGWSFELCDVRGDHLALPFLLRQSKGIQQPSIEVVGEEDTTYVLQFSQDVFTNAIFVKLGLNGGDDLVNDSAIDSRLKAARKKGSQVKMALPYYRQGLGEQLTTILLDIIERPSMRMSMNDVWGHRCRGPDEREMVVVQEKALLYSMQIDGQPCSGSKQSQTRAVVIASHARAI